MREKPVWLDRVLLIIMLTMVLVNTMSTAHAPAPFVLDEVDMMSVFEDRFHE